jgi:hypothetical protein
MSLDQMPVWLAGTLVVMVPTALSMVCTHVVRKYVGLARLRTNNEVAGFKFATVGVLYAVLLAFAVIVVWEKFSVAEEYVAREAGAAATLYRLAEGMGDEPRATLRQALSAYIETAVTRDWPAMADGRDSAETTRAVMAIYKAAFTYSPTDYRGAMLLEETLRQINTMTESRRVRVVKATDAVPPALWLVLIGGAMVTIGFTFFFGTQNVMAQSAMTGGLSLLVFSALFVIVGMNQPFSGAIKVDPEPLIEVLAELGGILLQR